MTPKRFVISPTKAVINERNNVITTAIKVLDMWYKKTGIPFCKLKYL
jgi:hypothetical protein